MSDLEALFRSVHELTPDEVKQLYAYIIANRTKFTNRPTEPSNEPRVLGLHAHLGKAWMSEDFNDELPDEFWFGEE